jgi:Zn-dependent protease with chaperone function
VYVLLLLALTATGAGVGQIVAAGIGSADLRPAFADCIARPPASAASSVDAPGADAGALVAHLNAVSACIAPLQTRTTILAAAGALVLPLAAWLLMVGSGLRLRGRLLRTGAVGYRSAALDRVVETFDRTCDEFGLTGRRRPRLILGRPGGVTGRAFTTGVPFDRPTVVVPAAYAYTDPADLDLVVRHELAHVRSRDVTWAAAAWWAGWLVVPAVVVTLVPLLPPLTLLQPARWSASDRGYLSRSVLTALALAVATLVFRAWVLRGREHDADRRAVGGDREVTFGEAPAAPAAPAAPRAWTWRRWGWFSVHPDPVARAAAVARAEDPRVGGFAVAAATGLLALYTTQALKAGFDGLSTSGDAERVAAAVRRAADWTAAYARAPGPDLLTGVTGVNGADAKLGTSSAGWTLDLALGLGLLVWAAVLVPLWARAGRVSLPAVAGSTLGLTVGLFLRPPGTPASHLADWFGAHPVLAVVWTAVVAAGVSLLAAGLATGVPLDRRPASSRGPAVVAVVIAVAVVTVVATTGFGALLAVLGQHVAVLAAGRAPAAVDRTSLLFVARAEPLWEWTSLVLPAGAAGLVLVTARSSWRSWGRPFAVTVGAGFLAGAAVAVVTTGTLLGPGRSEDDLVLLASRRWWIGGLGGWATGLVLLVLLVRRRVAAAAALSVVAGELTAVAVGLGPFLLDLVGPQSTGPVRAGLTGLVREPSWVCTEVLVLAGPVVLLGALAAPRVAPAAARLAAARGPIVSGPVTAAVVTLLTLPVATGLAAPWSTDRGDARLALTALFGPGGSADLRAASPPPVRALTPAQVGAVLDRLETVALSDWRKQPHPRDRIPPGLGPARCRAELRAGEAAEDARRTGADETRRYTFGRSTLVVTLDVGLTSYPDPAQARASFAAFGAEVRACRRYHFTRPGAGGGGAERFEARMSPEPALGAGHPSSMVTITAEGGRSGVRTSSAQGAVLVGTTTATVGESFSWTGPATADTDDILRIMRDQRGRLLRALVVALE